MSVKKKIMTILLGSVLFFACQFCTTSHIFNGVAEATVVSIVDHKLMVDIDDSSIKKISSNNAAVGIKVYIERHGWGNYFTIDVNWSNGAKAHRIDNGKEMADDLAQTVAAYLRNKLNGQTTSSVKPKMPHSEWNVGGVGYGCTLGYVKSVYGEPQEKIILGVSTNGSLRNVKYIYSPTFEIWGVGTKAEEDLKVFGFKCTDSTLQTPSGFHVGMPYSALTKKYKSGKKIVRKGRTFYQHDCLHFYVDEQEMITEIELITDI